ncbi:class I SAM-dependent methyltransferase [Candidatus Gottesmanbacteria bacterium]|nr:class I SAM-dependent methyltransferase [Candidatus Gottesmanbacteria bacterium]
MATKKQLILNLGSGTYPMAHAINVDIQKTAGVDMAIDLTRFPWKWKNDSVDGIYMIHVLEHFEDIKKVISECHRMLKKGGFLFLAVPHSSAAGGIGCIGHYRTFSYYTFNDYLCRDFYLFKKTLFRSVHQRIIWLHPTNVLERAISMPIQFLIDLAPRFFERIWCYYVGGAAEVQWKGLKV